MSPLAAPEYIELVHLDADANRNDGDNGDDIQHAYCTKCWPTPRRGIPALCGALRPTDRPYRPLGAVIDNPCVVCVDLWSTPCLKCGAL